MCDSFVALPPATAEGTVILGKSADCQVNEALALVRKPARKHIPGESFKAAHIVVPQIENTHEIIVGKSFWTWGGEIGINEHGVAIGNEAVWTTVQGEEKLDGLVVTDMLRLGLERGRTAKEAVEAMASALVQFGQHGNCELTGNSYFDSSYLISDTSEAWVLEMAGREWVAKKLEDSIGAISNVFSISDDWDMSSLTKKVDWANFSDPEFVTLLGARERQGSSYGLLSAEKSNITVKTFFDILRHHPEGFHPADGKPIIDICVHAGPPEDKPLFQATGAMVSEAGPNGVIAWFTATSGTCVSIFKPVFPGVELPDIGPYPTEHFNPDSLWWKHELLHRRVMADFDNLVPEIRKTFDPLEAEFLANAPSVLTGTAAEKREFMEYCFRKADWATQKWIDRLAARTDLRFEHPDYHEMWRKFNAQAGLVGMLT